MKELESEIISVTELNTTLVEELKQQRDLEIELKEEYQRSLAYLTKDHEIYRE